MKNIFSITLTAFLLCNLLILSVLNATPARDKADRLAGEAEIQPQIPTLQPPIIHTDPESGTFHHFGLRVGDAKMHQTIKISNEVDPGSADLDFEISFSETRWDPDAATRQANPLTPKRIPQRDIRSEPDDMGYKWVDNFEPDGIEFEWIDISGFEGVQRFQFSSNTTTCALHLPFAFPFWDRSFEYVYLNSNGWASFTYSGEGSNISGDVENYPLLIDDESRSANTIVAYGTDITEGADIWFWTNGEDQAIAQWAGNRDQQFEIIFNANGLAVIQYGDNTSSGTATVGVNRGDGEHGWNISQSDQVVIEPGRTIAFGLGEVWDQWCSANPRAGSIEPGGEMDVELTIDPAGLDAGTYLSELVIHSNDPATPRVSYELRLELDDSMPPSDFKFEETENFHILHISDFTVDDAPAPANWQIGVFTPKNVCSGVLIWDGSEADLKAYGKVPGNHQFGDGNKFSFTALDPDASWEYPATATFTDGPVVWEEGASSEITLAIVSSREITLQMQSGWNLVSINVDPREFYVDGENRGPDIRTMWRGLGPEEANRVYILKDEHGSFWAPFYMSFINLQYWDIARGYGVKLSEASQISFAGRPIPPGKDIQVTSGWNTVAYFPDYDLRAEYPDYYALSSIIDRVVLAKDANGNFMSRDFTYSNMPRWTQGQAYHIKISGSDPVTLNYPPPQEEWEYFGNSKAPEHWIPSVSTGANMSVLIMSVLGDEVRDGDEIAAFGYDGRLLGSGVFYRERCGLAVWGDDASTQEIEGAWAGMPFSLKIWQPLRGIERPLRIDRMLNGQGLDYGTDRFVVLDAIIDGTLPDSYYLDKSYPNPFNSTLNITFGLPYISQVSLKVFDLRGRQIATLVNEQKTAGEFSVTWDAGNVSSGVYLLRMTAGNFVASQKVMLLR